MADEEIRKAVIIGINKYADADIPELTGAENDADEMRQILKEFGHFEIADSHFLAGKRATYMAIRKAVSDLLWKADSCNLTFFYFSGHGFRDSYGNGYIAPYDMLKGEPFVCGINMSELKQIILNSVNKKSVLVILDCCYSGISAEGVKAIPSVESPFDPFFENLDKEKGAEGKFIFTSSEAEKESDELKNCTHEIRNDPHPHGTFTFHLIEGLTGKAADEAGIITLGKLRSYVEDQLLRKGKQKPKSFIASATQIERIQIAIASKKYNEYIMKMIEEAANNCCSGDPTLIIFAACNIYKVLEINAKNADALDLKNRVDETLNKYRASVWKWLLNNRLRVKPRIPNVFQELERLVDSLYFDKIIKLADQEINLLTYLYEVSIEERKIDSFIELCMQYNNPTSMRNPIAAGAPK